MKQISAYQQNILIIFYWQRVYKYVCSEPERETEKNMATMMSKPDFQNPLQFINDVVVCIGPIRFEYVLCKNYL
jgi:hypothetical protein